MNPFQSPEAKQVFTDLLRGLLEENHRGAVLVGTAYVDKQLTLLLECVFPAALSAKRRKELLRYPGPLSTLSGKTEVAYALRIISEHMYGSLHCLRELRNEVAHDPAAFTLTGQEERYQRIFQLGPNVPQGIRRVALEMVYEAKTQAVIEAIAAFQREEGIAPVAVTKEDALNYIQSNDDLRAVIEAQLPQWELACGLGLLCATLIMTRQRITAQLGPDTTIVQLLSSDDAEGDAP